MKNVFFRTVAIIAIALVTMSLTANAQEQGDIAVGGSVALGSGNSYTNIGLSGKVQYNILESIRAEGAFTYFLKKDYMSMWDLSVNGNYLLPINETMIVYPLAGLGVLGFKSTGWSSDPKLCVNLGGGIDITLTNNLIFNAEAKYKIVEEDWSRFVLSAGITFLFW